MTTPTPPTIYGTATDAEKSALFEISQNARLRAAAIGFGLSIHFDRDLKLIHPAMQIRKIETVYVLDQNETPEEAGVIADITIRTQMEAAAICFSAKLNFDRIAKPAEQYTTCGHCGMDTKLPPAEPTQCPATGWDTHPDPTGGIISKHGIDQPLELAAERAASLKKDQLLAAADREIAGLKQKHDEAQKQIAGLKRELNSQDRKIADLEYGNQMLRGNIAELDNGIASKDRRIVGLNVLLDSERLAVKELDQEIGNLNSELDHYKQRHDELSQAFYDETDGPAVKDNPADWIRQSKRLRKSFNELVVSRTPDEIRGIVNSPNFPRQR